jgi:hypothetical protein
MAQVYYLCMTVSTKLHDYRLFDQRRYERLTSIDERLNFQPCFRQTTTDVVK